MAAFADKVRDGSWTGYTGKRIRHVVNIGIGGSDLGPKMVVQALRHLASPDTRYALRLERRRRRPRRRAADASTRKRRSFIIASKTFTTQETHDQRALRARLVHDAGRPRRRAREALRRASRRTRRKWSSSASTPETFGFWDWVGGRYSLWSAIGLPIAARGRSGATSTSCSPARTRWTSTSAPRRWSRTCRCCSACSASGTATSSARRAQRRAVSSKPCIACRRTCSSWRWRATASGVDCDGTLVDYPTAAVIWGEPGTNGQHAFFQMLHQGTDDRPGRVHRRARRPSIRSSIITRSCSPTASRRAKR